jgi:hypothetical protein
MMYNSDDVRAARFALKVGFNQDEIQDHGDQQVFQRGKDVLKAARLAHGDASIQTMWATFDPEPRPSAVSPIVLMPVGWVGTEQSLAPFWLEARTPGRPRGEDGSQRSHTVRPGFTAAEWALLKEAAGTEAAIAEYVREAALVKARLAC